MRDASDGRARDVSICECCGRETIHAVEGLFSNPKPGSTRRFCDPACRQAAYRRRRAGVAETTPIQRQGGRNRRLQPTQEVTPTAN